jgi:hypothetical protein
MKTMARRAPTQNDYNRRFNQIEHLEQFLGLGMRGVEIVGLPDAEEWISIAEKAAEGHDKPGIVRMTLAQVLSGMPPEHKEEA